MSSDTPLKVHYTAPCAVVFYFDKEVDTGDDFACKDIQSFLIKFPEPFPLMFCVLVEEQEHSRSHVLLSFPMTRAVFSTMKIMDDSMMTLCLRTSGLFLSFPFREIMEEFTEIVEKWLDEQGTASATSAIPSESVAQSDVPTTGGVDTLKVMEFLREKMAEVAAIKLREKAAHISGALEDFAED